MGDHVSEVMDGGCVDRGDAGVMGVIAAGREGTDTAVIHVGACRRINGAFSRRFAWR
jgi:hypothetical protein